MAPSKRARPKKVPPDASWDDDNNEWTVAERDGKKRKHGPFRSYHPDGRLLAEGTYDHGKRVGAYRQYHEGGDLAVAGSYRDGRDHGTWTFYATDGETTAEPISSSSDVWTMEADHLSGEPYGTRFFTRAGIQVDAAGVRVGRPPAGVPSHARRLEVGQVWLWQVREPTQLKLWQADGTPRGDLALLDGVLQGPYLRFHDNGELAERGAYAAGYRSGTVQRFRSTAPSAEEAMDTVASAIWRRDEEHHGECWLSSRYYDAAGREVTEDGRPIEIPPPPERLDPGALPASRRDLNNYVVDRFEADLRRLHGACAQVTDFWEAPRPLASWIDRVGPDTVAAARTLDALIRSGTFPLLSSFDVSGYGFDFERAGLLPDHAAHVVALACSGAGDYFVLDLRSGRVAVYDHEADELIDGRTFSSLDSCCWSMVIVEAVFAKTIDRDAVAAAFRGLGDTAGLAELRLS